jgi:hypothetical protein
MSDENGKAGTTAALLGGTMGVEGDLNRMNVQWSTPGNTWGTVDGILVTDAFDLGAPSNEVKPMASYRKSTFSLFGWGFSLQWPVIIGRSSDDHRAGRKRKRKRRITGRCLPSRRPREPAQRRR